VLFQAKDGPLMLFYKVGPSPSAWWGMLKTSTDGGKTWSADAMRLPDGFLGPVKNKPVVLSDGSILCPSSTESGSAAVDAADRGWRLCFERTSDLGKTWTKLRPPPGEPPIDAIQPSVLTHGGGKLQALGRTRSGRMFETWSEDDGATWSPVKLMDLPNPNSGTDAVTLADGRHLLVYNHNPMNKGRAPLNLAVSKDGKAWQAVAILDDGPGQYSYPAVIQAADGRVHVTYTWKRERIKHAVIDPAKIVPIGDIVGGAWPAKSN
jgi:predicted neuraminidase